MKFFPKNKIVIIGIICCTIAIVMTLILVRWNCKVFTSRSSEDYTFNIVDNTVIEQKLPSKITSLSFYLMVDKTISNNEQDSAIELELISKNGDKQLEKLYIDNFKNSGWQLVNTDFKFDIDDTYEIIIKGDNTIDGSAIVLISKANEIYTSDHCVIDGEAVEGCVNIAYTYYNYDNFTKIFIKVIIVLLVVGIGLSIIKESLMRFPIATIATILMIIASINSHIWNIETSGWITGTWLSDYRYGFVNRGFGAQILTAVNKLFMGDDFISAAFLNKWLLCITLVLFSIVIFTIYRFEKIGRVKGIYNEQEILLYMWILSPFFVTYFTSEVTFGRIDVLLMIIWFISINIFKSKRMISNMLIIIVSCIAILVYEGYTFFYFPSLFILLLANIVYLNDKKKINIIGIVTVIVLTMTIFIHFYGNISSHATMGNYFETIIGRTDAKIDYTQAVTYPFGIFDGSIQKDIQDYHLYACVFMYIILLSPIIIFIEQVYYKCFKESKKNEEKILYLLSAISPLSIIFTINDSASDYLRYIVQIMTAFLTTTIVLLNYEEAPVKKAINIVDASYKKVFGKYYLAIIMIILTSTGIYLSGWPVTDLIYEIINLLGLLAQ